MSWRPDARPVQPSVNPIRSVRLASSHLTSPHLSPPQSTSVRLTTTTLASAVADSASSICCSEAESISTDALALMVQGSPPGVLFAEMAALVPRDTFVLIPISVAVFKNRLPAGILPKVSSVTNSLSLILNWIVNRSDQRISVNSHPTLLSHRRPRASGHRPSLLSPAFYQIFTLERPTCRSC